MPIKSIDAFFSVGPLFCLVDAFTSFPFQWHDAEARVHHLRFLYKLSKPHAEIGRASFCRVSHEPDFHRADHHLSLETTVTVVTTVPALASVSRALACPSVFMLLYLTQWCSFFSRTDYFPVHIVAAIFFVIFCCSNHVALCIGICTYEEVTWSARVVSF
jgi:hypothetical protein